MFFLQRSWYKHWFSLLRTLREINKQRKVFKQWKKYPSLFKNKYSNFINYNTYEGEATDLLRRKIKILESQDKNLNLPTIILDGITFKWYQAKGDLFRNHESEWYCDALVFFHKYLSWTDKEISFIMRIIASSYEYHIKKNRWWDKDSIKDMDSFIKCALDVDNGLDLSYEEFLNLINE